MSSGEELICSLAYGKFQSEMDERLLPTINASKIQVGIDEPDLVSNPTRDE
jgi:hypothetical protein